MASQPSITEFFNKRKRSASINVKSRTKTLVLEAQKSTKVTSNLQEKSDSVTQIVYQQPASIEPCIRTPRSSIKTPLTSKKASSSARKCKTTAPLSRDKLKQCLLTRFTRKASTEETSEAENFSESIEDSDASNVGTSATSVCTTPSSSFDVPSTPCSDGNSKIDISYLPSQMQKSPSKCSTPSKDMSLKEITAKLKSSKRLKDLQESLQKFGHLDSKLKDLNAENERLKLQKFNPIELEVPDSPRKTVPYASPVKAGCISPRPSPSKTQGSRLAAWQQLQSLAEARVPTLPLPWHYRCLSETFRAVDTVASMMCHRKETVTFSKLHPAVEEMTRMNFSEKHLGKIKKLFPKAFTFHQEKCKNFALTGRADKYELIITPQQDRLESKEVNTNYTGKGVIAPTILLERRRHFHHLLVERVKDFHQEFLSCLEPPLIIERNKLTRWHPDFDPEQIPDVEVEPLPQPPNVEKFTTANDVLKYARTMMSCNRRLTDALERVSNPSMTGASNPSIAGVSNPSMTAKAPQLATPDSTPGASTSGAVPLSPALKGIPSTLLEKIRAKQAARALEAMTRTPAQDARSQKLNRLPEMARILRNLFVSEKKSVLPLDFVLEKLQHSYPSNLPLKSLDEHLVVLAEEVPGWIERIFLRQNTFLRLHKNAIMSQVMAKLESKSKL